MVFRRRCRLGAFRHCRQSISLAILVASSEYSSSFFVRSRCRYNISVGDSRKGVVGSYSRRLLFRAVGSGLRSNLFGWAMTNRRRMMKAAGAEPDSQSPWSQVPRTGLSTEDETRTAGMRTSGGCARVPRVKFEKGPLRESKGTEAVGETGTRRQRNGMKGKEWREKKQGNGLCVDAGGDGGCVCVCVCYVVGGKGIEVVKLSVRTPCVADPSYWSAPNGGICTPRPGRIQFSAPPFSNLLFWEVRLSTPARFSTHLQEGSSIVF